VPCWADFITTTPVFKFPVHTTDLETVIQDLLSGQYKNPIRVVAFNTAERWSEDVSEDVAHELRRRCDLQMRDVPLCLQDFTECHEGRYATPSYRCRCAWPDNGIPAQETGGDRPQGALSRLHRAGVIVGPAVNGAIGASAWGGNIGLSSVMVLLCLKGF
jgi:hypothetical protein